jgi:2-polyprenyl-6-methoxyphenol hydroxylase-like FAD-dependent oxidoreductase
VHKTDTKTINQSACTECKGLGKQKLRLKKKVRSQYQKALTEFEENNKQGKAPIKPKANLSPCTNCKGTGLIKTSIPPTTDNERYPHVAIIGGGIGGTALAVACMHRSIPFTLFERDDNFDARSQGYGLTLQQASKAIQGLGISSLEKGIVSTRHVVHATDGKILGEWGMRKWLQTNEKKTNKRTNIHIARQSLRLALIEQLDGNQNIKWGHKLLNFNQNKEKGFDLNFEINGEVQNYTSDIIVGADGIRSTVRELIIGDKATPLNYLGCIVILGICSLEILKKTESPLLDSETVFQTANGNERIYMMPFDSESIMWQLSFPMSEEEAKSLSSKGVKALKEEASKRTQWHSPIPEIISATPETQISGYPVYDRSLLSQNNFKNTGDITLIGDAAHPMSPFKGQGANQALLDALSLARSLVKGTNASNWKEQGVRKSILEEFEAEMIERSKSKVKDSAAAAEFLHSEIALQEIDEPRGKCLKRERKI